MSGIFISYRRVDTIAWAGRLFDHLSARFGKSMVFMDIEGGIPRGAEFERVLSMALAGCDALLVLIGPAWLNCRSAEGSRRLDMPDDWVRNEIAASLQRNIPVIPVLLGKALLPGINELPEGLRPLLNHQAAELTDTRWLYDVGELVKDLVKLTTLKLLDDFTSASTGIQLLRDLIARIPKVAETVGRSKEMIETTCRQAGKLEAFKIIHDRLHTIEFECLRPMLAGGVTSRLRPFKIRFSAEARGMRETTTQAEMDSYLRDDIMDSLEQTGRAFQTAEEAPGEESFLQVVSELNMLLSSLPPRLDSGIAYAAAELNLDRLVELMKKVQDTFAAATTGSGSELEPLSNSVDALCRLRDELRYRVAEHGRLQRLDSKLRAVCVEGANPDVVAGEWKRVKRMRSGLVPPYSPELETAVGDLTAIEEEIEAAVKRGERQLALDMLMEYFRSIAFVFRDVDGSLKALCLQLNTVSQPLKIVLDLC